MLGDTDSWVPPEIGRGEVRLEYRTLGRTGLKVSLAGLGTGGPARVGQTAGLSTGESHRLIRTALDLGVNLFDTSPAYGRSEELLGGALRGVPRGEYVLATKFPPYYEDRVKSDPGALTSQLEESLRRLGTEYVDMLQYHAVRPQTYRAVVERFHPVAVRAREQGKVRFLGITEAGGTDPEHEMLPLALESGLFDTIMIKHGILNQAGCRRVLPMAAERNVGVLVMASVRRSLRTAHEAVQTLTEMIDRSLLDVPRPTLDDPLGLAAVGGEIPTVTRAAYLFAAQSQAVSSVLVGTGHVAHLRQNVADLTSPRLTEAQYDYLRRTYGHLAWPS